MEATAGAIDNQIGVTSDLALLNNNKLKVDFIAKISNKKITLYDKLDFRVTLTVSGNLPSGSPLLIT